MLGMMHAHHTHGGLKTEWGHPASSLNLSPALAAAAYASYNHQGMQQI